MARARTAPGRRAAAGDKDFVSRLAEAGEEALQRLADLPGGQKAVQAVNDLRSGVDELGRKVRGIEGLEDRVAKLEKEVAALKRAKPATRRSTGSRTRTRPPSST